MKAHCFPSMNRISIRMRLALVILLQMILLLSICTSVLVSESRRLTRYYEASNLQSAVVLHQTASHYLEALSSVTAFPVQQENAYSSSLFSLLSQEVDTMNSYEFQNCFRIQSRQLFDLYDFMDTIMIYNVRGEGNYLERTRRYDAVCLLEMPHGDWVERALEARGGMVLFSAEEGTGFGITSKEGRLIGVARSIINTDKMRSVGLIAAGFSPDQLETVFDSVQQLTGQTYCIFYGDQFLAGDLKNDENVLPLLSRESSETGRTDYALLGSDRYMYSIYHPEGNLSAVIRTPVSALRAMQRPSASLYLVLALVLAASLYIVYTCTSGILHPIHMLMKACTQLEQLDSFVRVTGEAPAEIAQLYRTFNHMSQRIHTLVREVLMQELAQNKLELQMLRAQISPHYLYNTLESMRMSAYTHGNMQVAQMAEMLAHNLQYILRGTNQEVCVREEIESVDEYARLVSLHYSGRLCLHIDIAEEALHCLTIKLVLQPLVENAIHHGLKDTSTLLNIDIHGYLSEDALFFVVSDDGKGMPPDRLASLRASLSSSAEQPGDSIGIKNLHRRLSLYYGEGYGVEIRSVEGLGTTVTVRLPIRHAESHDRRENPCVPS